MVSLNINVNELKTLLGLAQLKGLDNSGKVNSMFENCVMIVNKRSKTIEINIAGEHGAVISMIKMKCGNGIILKGGNVPIKFENIMSTLDKCKDTIKFEYKNGKYVITPPNDSVIYTKAAIDEDEIDNNLDVSILNWEYTQKTNNWTSKKYKLNTYFTISSEEFRKLISDAKEVDYYIYTVYITPKGVKFIVYNSEDGSNSERDLKVEELTCKSDIESIYSIGIGNVINNLNGKEIECWTANNSPFIIEFTTNNIEATYILSPYNADEEEQVSEESDTEDEMTDELEDSINDIDEEDEEYEDEDDFDEEITEEDLYNEEDEQL